MKVMILGSGQMGPAAAYRSLQSSSVSRVIVTDVQNDRLKECAAIVEPLGRSDAFATHCLDITDRKATIDAFRQCDIAISALPRSLSPHGIEGALEAGVPMVDIARPELSKIKHYEEVAERSFRNTAVVLGCGLEPGLAEVMACHLADRLDQTNRLHIRCGGIPSEPVPPLGHRSLFGGRTMPFRAEEASAIEGGQRISVPRYSGVEPLTVDGVGECEAYHEGLTAWLVEDPRFSALSEATQKTIRWPGYAAKVCLLRELGLLGSQPIEVDGVRVAPKSVVDALLAPRLMSGPRDSDITILRVTAEGTLRGKQARMTIEMVDRSDSASGLSSMARTTAFTAVSVALRMARGDLQVSGVRTVEKVITGSALEGLLGDLGEAGIHFHGIEEKSGVLPFSELP